MDNSTGKIPVTTEATGATTPMRPTASALYSAAIPNAPETPAKTPHSRSTRGGTGSPVSHAIDSIESNPTKCAPATTRNTLARLEATPPEKSPPPHAAAASRLSPDVSIVAVVICRYDTQSGRG